VAAARRAGTPVVEGINLEIAPGKVLGIVGESGSGKTTFALSLLGYAKRGLRIAAGEVLLDNVDLLSLPAGRLREIRGLRVTYVPQDPASALNPSQRIRTQMREPLEVHRSQLDPDLDIDARLAEVCAAANLPTTDKILDAYPHQLSGGQQQRVAIAMAFACGPELIVLDEPTTGLDVTTQRHILETIRRLTSENDVAAVYVSHDLPVVAQIADDVAVMYAGRVIEVGPIKAVMTAPAHPYTRALLRAAPTPERTSALVGIDGSPPSPGQWPVGCAFAPRCPLAVSECRSELPDLKVRGGRTQRVRCIRSTVAVREEPRRAIVAPLAPDAPVAGGELAIEGLDAHYGAFHVLRDVSLQVARGECVGVVGESGSGKTTLARCVVGMHRTWTGRMLLDGKPLASRGREFEHRRKVQYIFQNPYTSLNPRHTVGESLAAPLRHFEDVDRAECAGRVRAMLERVALRADFVDRYPDQLSGGERQRVAIGRALIVEPEFVICDEVTSALDVSVQAVIIELLRQMQAERAISMLFITHNIAVMRSIAQRVVVLNEGRLVENGTVDQVMTKPRDPYTVRLLADVPKMSEAVNENG